MVAFNNTIDIVRQHYYFPKLATIVADYVRSCHECQLRKTTKVPTKSSVTYFRTPSSPFEAWQIDLYGPVPISANGNSYVFTAVDLFSKFLFVLPIPNKDVLTVSHCLFLLFTQFGVCDSLVSDQGSEFVSKCTKEVCRLFDIPQQYTPAFTHHCLGACERQHRTLAERLSPFMIQGKNWEDVLPAVVFSMNNSINSTLKYTPFEIVFGNRPKFPLSLHIVDTNFSDIPVDCHQYVTRHVIRLNTIREEVKCNTLKSQIKMIDRANANINPLSLVTGDYVYLSSEPSGPGRKFKARFTGPFIVADVQSSHMILLKDPVTGICQDKPVHINRLKIAYIRMPNPSNFFIDSVVTHPDNQHTTLELVNEDHSSDKDLIVHGSDQYSDSPTFNVTTDVDQNVSSEIFNTTTEVDSINDKDVFNSSTQLDIASTSSDILFTSDSFNNELSVRQKRMRRKPERYRNSDHVDIDVLLGSSEDSSLVKIKRVLAQRNTDQGIQYLVHPIGEPAQHSFWVPVHKLDTKAKKFVASKPPPIIK